jgi:hypothetical protein
VDKADAAIIIAVVSALASILSAGFTWRLARNDTARMKRKAIVVETTVIAPQSFPPGWQSAHMTLRNLEPVTAEVSGVMTTAKGALLLRTEEVTILDGVTPFPMDNASRRVGVGCTLYPAGTLGRTGKPANVGALRFYVYGPCRPDQLHVEWRWADGAKS